MQSFTCHSKLRKAHTVPAVVLTTCCLEAVCRFVCMVVIRLTMQSLLRPGVRPYGRDSAHHAIVHTSSAWSCFGLPCNRLLLCVCVHVSVSPWTPLVAECAALWRASASDLLGCPVFVLVFRSQPSLLCILVFYGCGQNQAMVSACCGGVCHSMASTWYLPHLRCI